MIDMENMFDLLATNPKLQVCCILSCMRHSGCRVHCCLELDRRPGSQVKPVLIPVLSGCT
jgi:hypothetical protein